jgi:hypothetical protein
MDFSGIARALGRRGGLSRARRLSGRRRADIARMGAAARSESFRLAEAIRTNFDYVSAIDRLRPPEQVRSEPTCNRRLPGIYAVDTRPGGLRPPSTTT